MRLLVLISVVIVIAVMLTGCSVDMVWFGEGLRRVSEVL